MDEKRLDCKVPAHIKAMLEEVYHTRSLKGEKLMKRDIIKEGIMLVYEKEFPGREKICKKKCKGIQTDLLDFIQKIFS